MANDKKIEEMIENLAATMERGFADQKKRFDEKFVVQEKRFDEKIGDLAATMERGFAAQDEKFVVIEKRFDKKIDDLARAVARGFAAQDERFDKQDIKFDRIDKRLEKLEADNVWTRNVLEQHTTILARLDQERIFTISHVNRLEDEINKIKKQLKIA